jgi:hypothetical protein
LNKTPSCINITFQRAKEKIVRKYALWIKYVLNKIWKRGNKYGFWSNSRRYKTRKKWQKKRVER